ncbi:MAG: MFS transporter [Candidatus Heimdallarchaeota archaeon]|nr:MFS transporter [Candidatus Heimdallarchaeota archaeon]MDH5647026.1 MFS transporter [Candidatus Heimdallarchaeota archaeon]
MELTKGDVNYLKNAFYVSKVNWNSITLPSIVVIWLNVGMSLSQILFLQGLFVLLLIILEFPSGVMADRFTRKSMVIFAFIFMTFGVFSYGRAGNFIEFFIAESFFAVGFATLSGTDSALVWDGFKSINQEDKAKSVLAKGNTILMGSAVILLLIGGILMTYSLIFPFYVSILGNLNQIFLYSKIKEPPRQKMGKTSHIYRDSLTLLKKSSMWIIIFISAINSLVLRVVFWAYLPKLKLLQVDEIWFGVVLSGANLIAMLMSIYYHKNTNPSNRITGFIMILCTIGVLLFALEVSLILMLVAIAFHQIGRATVRYLSVVKMNEAVDSDIRASAISLMNTFSSIFYIIFNLISEWYKLSLQQIMKLTAINMIILSMFIIAINYRDQLKVYFKIKKESIISI